MTDVMVVDPCTAAEWATLAAADGASVFTSPPWLATLADTYDLQLRGIVVMDGARPRSGMAYTVVDDAAGARAQSLPFSDYADPILGDPEDLIPLLDAFAAEAGEATRRIRVLHAPRPPYETDMATAGALAWHTVAVGGGGLTVDDLWARLGGSARRNVRKARDCGVRVRFTDASADVETFFALHLGTRKHKHGLLPQPLSFFQNMQKRFEPSEGYWLAIAELDGRPVAAISLLEWNGDAYYKFNASSGEELDVRPNDLLMWECIRFAHERGDRTLDLGVSDLDQPGLIRYKRKFSTAEAEVTTYSAGDTDPRVVDLKQRLGMLTEALTDPSVPDAVTAEAGALFYRYFS